MDATARSSGTGMRWGDFDALIARPAAALPDASATTARTPMNTRLERRASGARARPESPARKSPLSILGGDCLSRP